MHDESLPGTKQADTDYTKDEALMVAEGPSTLRELVHGFHARGFALAELEKENREGTVSVWPAGEPDGV